MRIVTFTLLLLLMPAVASAETVYEYVHSATGMALIVSVEEEFGITLDGERFLEEPVIRELLSDTADVVIDDMNLAAFIGLSKELNYQEYLMTWQERRAVDRWKNGKACYVDWDSTVIGWLFVEDGRLERFKEAVSDNVTGLRR